MNYLLMISSIFLFLLLFWYIIDGVNRSLMSLVLFPRIQVIVMAGLLDKYFKMIYTHYVSNDLISFNDDKI